MDVRPELYSQSNETQLKDALIMIQKHVVGKEGSVMLAVDIGCGTGEATALLASHLHKSAQILAFDCDPQMVQFCKESLQKRQDVEEASGCSVAYFQDDISLEWQDLSKQLQTVEGQVDLVFANLVFHWILPSRRAFAVSNILRLLKPGAQIRFIVSILLYSPIDDCVASTVEKERIGSFIKVPSFEEQGNFWRHYFQSESYTNKWTIQGHLLFKDWTDKNTSLQKANAIRETFVTIVKGQINNLHKFFIREMYSEEKGKFLNDIFESNFSAYITQVQEENEVICSRVRYTVLELSRCTK